MQKNELPGTLVMIDPGLDNDPAGRKGDIAIVAYVDAPNEEVYLRFTDEFEAVYPAEALFALKDREMIFAGQAGRDSEIDLDGYKDLYKITTLQDRGRSVDIWNALEVARDNPGIWKDSLINISEGLGLGQAQTIGR